MKATLLTGLILIITLTSCKTTLATNYGIRDKEKRDYYTNKIEYVGANKDSIRFSEINRNGKLRGTHTLALKDIKLRER